MCQTLLSVLGAVSHCLCFPLFSIDYINSHFSACLLCAYIFTSFISFHLHSIPENQLIEEEIEAQVKAIQKSLISSLYPLGKYAQSACCVPGTVLGVADKNPDLFPGAFSLWTSPYNGVIRPLHREQDLGGGTANLGAPLPGPESQAGN